MCGGGAPEEVRCHLSHTSHTHTHCEFSSTTQLCARVCTTLAPALVVCCEIMNFLFTPMKLLAREFRCKCVDLWRAEFIYLARASSSSPCCFVKSILLARSLVAFSLHARYHYYHYYMLRSRLVVALVASVATRRR